MRVKDVMTQHPVIAMRRVRHHPTMETSHSVWFISWGAGQFQCFIYMN
jgi:hypothetical protein